jgi:DNA-directed RNA polymerase specialized sigma54-like protein
MISRGLASCKSLRRISQELGGAASTISREVPAMADLKNIGHAMPRKLFSSAVDASSPHCFPRMRS